MKIAIYPEFKQADILTNIFSNDTFSEKKLLSQVNSSAPAVTLQLDLSQLLKKH